MAAKKKETAYGDSISSLPDEVLGQILSLLPTKTAASTSVLSKRWRNLLPLVHNLDFDEPMVLSNSIFKWFNDKNSEFTGRGFFDSVEKTLVLLRGSPIKKFSMKWKSLFNESCANCLIYTVLKHEVLELHLSPAAFQSLESEYFFSKTLVKLTLSHGCFYQNNTLLGGVLFPALKTLCLFSAGFELGDGDLYDCLLASPVLEEVNICDNDPLTSLLYSGWKKQVWGSSIQRISIFYHYHPFEDHSCFVIKTPNLVYLDYSSYVAQDYVVQFDSLVEARLDLRLWK